MKKQRAPRLSIRKQTVSHLLPHEQEQVKGGATQLVLCGSRRACSQPVSLCPCISAQACSEYNCTIVA